MSTHAFPTSHGLTFIRTVLPGLTTVIGGYCSSKSNSHPTPRTAEIRASPVPEFVNSHTCQSNSPVSASVAWPKVPTSRLTYGALRRSRRSVRTTKYSVTAESSAPAHPPSAPTTAHRSMAASKQAADHTHK